MAFNTVQCSKPLNLYLYTSLLHTRLTPPTFTLTFPLKSLINVSNLTYSQMNDYSIIIQWLFNQKYWFWPLFASPLHPYLFFPRFFSLFVETAGIPLLKPKELEVNPWLLTVSHAHSIHLPLLLSTIQYHTLISTYKIDVGQEHFQLPFYYHPGLSHHHLDLPRLLHCLP